MKQLMTLLGKWFARRRGVIVDRKLHPVELPWGEVVQVSHSADCIGAACPRPQLVTMRMLETMSKGDVMELVSDNSTTVETIPALAMTLNSRHLATLHTDVGWRIYLRKEDED